MNNIFGLIGNGEDLGLSDGNVIGLPEGLTEGDALGESLGYSFGEELGEAF